MASVHIPALLRGLTGGADEVGVDIADGESLTVREVLRRLEQRFPGLTAALVEGEGFVPGIAAFIDGEPAGMGLMAKVRPADNLYFLAPIVGGA